MTMTNLKCYRHMPDWSAATANGAGDEHRTEEGTWVELSANSGSARLVLLGADDEVLSREVITPATGARRIEPHTRFRLEPLDATSTCERSCWCEPVRYMEKKHGLTAPHSEVRAALPALQGSRGRAVLDLGSGRGRNSFFLFEHGFEVTSVDRSEASIDKLRELQQVEGHQFTASVYDINSATLSDVLEGGEVDHIISTVVFQFLDAERVPEIISDMQAVTRDGGVHVIVAPITSEQLPCPIKFPFVFAREELCRYYGGWDVLHYEETLGEFHRRDENGERYKSEFATLVARNTAPVV